MKTLEGCSTNSASELTELYCSHLDALLRQANRITRNESDAEDCVQGAMVRLLEQDLTGVKNLRAYLFTATRHVAITQVRRPSRTVSLIFEAQAAINRPPAPSTPIDLDIYVELAGGDKRLIPIWSSLASDRTQAEIAHDLKCSPNAIKSLVWRARRSLRKHAPGGRRWS